ncbi:tyrosine-protein kinase STYK1-like isoform 1-T2 [Anomaloglossus baeobatrachus]|uniref:tyrosine-protein kinase STYK1-like n=1 Tax=Anomaloglossus baeobatrachus TaxID=238106 RepID=UPI003F500F27
MNSSEEFHRNENGWQNSVIIIPALLSGCTLVVVAIIVWRSVCNKVQRKESKEKTKGYLGDWAVNAAGVFENSLDAPDPVLEKRQLPAGWTLEHRAPLCDGHFGPISCGDLCRAGEDSQQVVVKEMSEHCSPGEVQDFIDLMKFYVQVCNHNNLVTMLWCQTTRRPPSIILKAMSYGNLLTVLRSSREVARTSEGGPPRITEKDVYSMALQVASGLEYLSGTHDLIHGYVAACNVLLHEDLSVQLCGLGLAAIQYRSGSVPLRRAAQVPLKWHSPERLKGADITEKSDVWSFGILLYELMTLGSPPYPDIEPSQLPSKLRKTFRMERPTLCGPQLSEVMSGCWQWEAPLRPCFTDLLKLLQNGQDQADRWTPLTPGDTLSWREYLSVAGIPT